MNIASGLDPAGAVSLVLNYVTAYQMLHVVVIAFEQSPYSACTSRVAGFFQAGGV